MSNEVLAQQEGQYPQPSDIEIEKPLVLPGLSELIPAVTKLSSRLAALEKRSLRGLDVATIQKSYAEIMTNIEDHSGELQRLKDEKEYRYSELIELKTRILFESNSLEALSKPLIESIRKIEASRKEWLDEKRNWSEWKAALLKDEPLDEVELIFKKAQKNINTALSLILKQLKSMLAVQQEAGAIQARIDPLVIEAQGLIIDVQDTVLIEESPPMFSSGYFSQFGSRLWHEVNKGMNEFQWLEKEFFARQGWVTFLQFLLALVLVIAIFRNRQQLESSEHWHFVGKRPFSAGIFVGFVTLIFFYEGTPATWILIFSIVMGVSFVRLLRGLIETSWKMHLVYGLVLFLITTRFLNVVGLPLPLFRLYILLAAVVGLFFCYWWAVAAHRRGDSMPYIWGYRLGYSFFAIVIILEILGKAGLAEYLFESLVRTVLALMVGWLLMYLTHGGLELSFQSSPLQRVTFLQNYSTVMVRRFKFLMNMLIGVLILSTLLVIWRVYDSPIAAFKGMLSLGFTVGSQRISVDLIIVAAGFVYGSFLISWSLQKLFLEGVLIKRHVDTGIKISISRLIHYALVSVGFFLALLALGFELTKLTIILSAFGIGIGFGLQTIVNNFICGLILLFERPIRVGDYIELGGKWAEIKRIGLRSTTVQTFDHADVIIPNADLITNQVTNWTLTDRSVRIIIPVGVAYGSDVPLVIEALMKCGTANDKVARIPEPQVLFRSFGASSLDFELRVWTLDANNRLELQSELHQEIDQRFRQAGIEIAFPQRDLHIRSVEEDTDSKLKRDRKPPSDHKGVSGNEGEENGH
jgi:small-conductance mechanosensitive channel